MATSPFALLRWIWLPTNLQPHMLRYLEVKKSTYCSIWNKQQFSVFKGTWRGAKCLKKSWSHGKNEKKWVWRKRILLSNAFIFSSSFSRFPWYFLYQSLNPWRNLMISWKGGKKEEKETRAWSFSRLVQKSSASKSRECVWAERNALFERKIKKNHNYSNRERTWNVRISLPEKAMHFNGKVRHSCTWCM